MKYAKIPEFSQYAEAVYQVEPKDGFADVQIKRIPITQFDEGSIKTILDAYVYLFGLDRDIDLSGNDMSIEPPEAMKEYIRKWLISFDLPSALPIKSWFGILTSIKARVKD